MSLKALRTLVTIARHGTFARAADVLSLTPSAVSLHIKTLEDELQVALFDRSRRQVVLTEAGQLAVARAESILAAYDELADTLACGPSLRGRLRIGAIHTVLARRLPKALVWIKANHPELHISVFSGMSAELARRVEDGELDAAITTEPVPPYPQSLHYTPLFEDRFWAIASPELAGQSLTQLLASQPFLRFDKRAWAGRQIEQELRRQRLQVSEQMELDSQEALARMAALGLGVAIIPMADDDLQRLPPAIRLPFGEPQLVRRVVLLEHEKSQRRHLSAVLRMALEA
ncbi:LysR family transcriptional regulator [Pseudomonas putida]|uniref:LysR family transcriptional regulator n=1 Tax=Pseudomonas putida TaxID=303 RepID=A0A1X0ZNT3_PSEPU|nr:LysR family transcriptional regulator [Pseudomonas putida]EKT4465660.1 LysR family transcriptional regulator [Pseudomonas putida]MEB3901444.1 LysR family transcriptional regulator [Pseudomonas putida]ORL60025.1 LysR family transcriptional regulator [Pseudomonas putida]